MVTTESDDMRLMSVVLAVAGVRYRFASAYVPTGDRQGRLHFFDGASELLDGSPETEQQVWLGDFNSHVGRDRCSGRYIAHATVGDFVRTPTVVGRFGMTTPTTTAGKQLLQWLEESPRPLCVADTFYQIGSRG
eukprot:143885-Pyramimonas_sp.AAC.1